MSSVLARLLGLPAPISRARVERDVRVPMRDGVELLADRWFPAAAEKAPTLVVRSPYGRRSFFGFLYGRLFAERGFQVLVQSCRGTFGSGGLFEPLVNEAADGADTIAWLRGQSWFDGRYATIGASYLCFAQWAAANRLPEFRAMVAQAGPHEFFGSIHPGGAFALDAALSFAAQVTGAESSAALVLVRQALARRRIKAAFRELPLGSSCERALGRHVGFLADWMTHVDPGDALWKAMDHREAVETIETPVLIQSGWYDLFAAYATSQYERLRDRGRRPFLTIGPWTHAEFAFRGARTLMPETLAWLRAHLLDDRRGLREAPVRVFVLGADRWREYPDWPPPDARAEVWHLHPDARLARDSPSSSAPDGYRYDPADPTPSVGGGMILFGAGPRDNRALESRPDVRTYTSAPFEDDKTIVGSPSVSLHVASSSRSTDFFARLCDVHPDGRSVNLCDALVRLRPGDALWQADGTARLKIRLSPTACRFARGHRLRLQVSSGAHPRFARNTGTEESLATGARLVAADQTVFHDRERPSSIEILATSSG